jgi:hypothetical protein
MHLHQNYFLFIALLFGSLQINSQSLRQNVKIKGDTASITNNLDTAIILSQQGYKIFYHVYGDTTETFPADFREIPSDKLIGFMCTDCRIQKLPDYFKDYPNLQILGVRWYLNDDYDFKNESFLRSVFTLDSLRYLEVFGFPIDFPIEIESKQLERLDLTNCRLDSFPISIYSCDKLVSLYIGCNEITSIPDGLSNLSSLKTLSCSGGACGGNPLKSITEEIGTLQNLEFLDVANSELTTLPSSLFSLPKLEHLSLWYSGLEYFPEIPKTATLKSLRMAADSTFQFFSKNMENLPLEKLYIDILLPCSSAAQSSHHVYKMRKEIPDFKMSLRGDAVYYEYNDFGESFMDMWELVESSNEANIIQLFPNLPKIGGKYFDTRSLAPYLISSIENELDDDFYYSDRPKPATFKLMLVDNLFYGTVRSSEEYPEIKGEFISFHVDFLEGRKYMKITNSSGDEFLLKRLK